EHDQVDHADIAELQAVVVVEREDPEEDDDLADPVERRVVECAELAAEPGQSRDAAVEDVEETAEQDEEAGPADLVLMEREARTECGEEAERREKIRMYAPADERIDQRPDDAVYATPHRLEAGPGVRTAG